MTLNRQSLKDRSNNKENPNKNWCGLTVANALGVANATLYLHTWSDLARAIRTCWSFRSVKTTFKVKPYQTTVGAVRVRIRRKYISKPSDPATDPRAYVVMVDHHVLMLDATGRTIIDTDPRERDARKIHKIYGVYFPSDNTIKLNKLATSLVNAEERVANR
jgi:hypothetical protein